MANSADPDQLASESEANWSGATLFTKAGYIPVQHDKGKENYKITKHIINKIQPLFQAFWTYQNCEKI